MDINPQIVETLSTFNIPLDDGKAYLLSVYFELKPSVFPDLLKQRINTTNIFSFKDGGIVWNVPLFTNEGTDSKWAWVEEWRLMFKKMNSGRAGSKTTVLTRMKSFFANNPDVRKEEVIAATKMYLNSITNPEYVVTSHYFIYKDKGADRSSALESWIETYRDKVNSLPKSQINDITSQMQ